MFMPEFNAKKWKLKNKIVHTPASIYSSLALPTVYHHSKYYEHRFSPQTTIDLRRCD